MECVNRNLKSIKEIFLTTNVIKISKDNGNKVKLYSLHIN